MLCDVTWNQEVMSSMWNEIMPCDNGKRRWRSHPNSVSVCLCVKSSCCSDLLTDPAGYLSLSLCYLVLMIGTNVSIRTNQAWATLSTDLLYVSFQIDFSYQLRRCCWGASHSAEMKSVDSLMCLWVLTGVLCCCEEGVRLICMCLKSDLCLIDSLFLPSSLVFISPSLSLFLLLTHTYRRFELWLKLPGVSLCISACPSLICVKRLRWLWGIGAEEGVCKVHAKEFQLMLRAAW